ncbi:unnamed protein product [Polarella glacialis]|uniref:Peptidase A2 domain-containing protein n=1 Tax=Polarella glacialis TaxID=89957 RepID=A0A813KCS4_POLGL|nr:unnamed protein product [Polarella glacialis]
MLDSNFNPVPKPVNIQLATLATKVSNLSVLRIRCVELSRKPEDEGMVTLTTAPLAAQLLAVSVELARGANSADGPTAVGEDQRVVGILDTGASHTVLNWAAASLLLGFTQAEDEERLVEEHGGTSSFDVSGRRIDMPMFEVALQLRGAGREPQGSCCFQPVEVAIGDIALFATLLGGSTESPAALIGQDLLIQRPMLFAARQRLLCFRSETRATIQLLD